MTYNFKAFMAIKFNKIFWGYQLHHMFEWRVNQCVKDHLCPRHQFPDDKDRDSPQNVGLLAMQPHDAVARLSIFYCTKNDV